jgi:hypothetical protein
LQEQKGINAMNILDVKKRNLLDFDDFFLSFATLKIMLNISEEKIIILPIKFYIDMSVPPSKAWHLNLNFNWLELRSSLDEETIFFL